MWKYKLIFILILSEMPGAEGLNLIVLAVCCIATKVLTNKFTFYRWSVRIVPLNLMALAVSCIAISAFLTMVLLR